MKILIIIEKIESRVYIDMVVDAASWFVPPSFAKKSIKTELDE